MSTPVSAQTRIIVHGATGRMGARLCESALTDHSLTLVGALCREGSPRLGGPCAPGAPAHAPALKTAKNLGVSADVVIDFSAENALPAAVETASRAGAALLVGTTGLGPASVARLREEARSRPVLLAANTSLGITILSRLAADAARFLGAGYDCSLLEAHHSAKKDAPSGTALRLAHAVRSAGFPLDDGQILSVRGGDVVGEHTIRFAGAGEYVELIHRATSRDLFVRGALHAAKWLSGRAPGWYSMEDVLGLPAS